MTPSHKAVAITTINIGGDDWWKFVQGVQACVDYHMETPKRLQSVYHAEYVGNKGTREIYQAFDELKKTVKANGSEVTTEVGPVEPDSTTAEINVEKKEKN